VCCLWGCLYSSEWPNLCWLILCQISELLAAFSVPVMCQCASLVFILSFYGKKFDLNSFDISSRLSVLCAFMLDVEICIHCFDSVVWPSGRMLAYSLNVCLYISARLSVLCAFMLDVDICFQCFDSVGWSSGRMLAYSLNVCLYISDRLRVFGYYTRCAIITVLCWESDVCEILALHNK